MLNIDLFLDDDFSGIYGHENPTDLSCVKMMTGCIIIFSDFIV